jgi:ABC-type sugar transport system permease subunit
MSAMGQSPPDAAEPWRPSAAFWFLLPAVTVLIAAYAGPLAYAVNASFTAWSLTVPGSDKIYVGLENYQDVLGSREYWRAVTVTLTYALSAVAIELVLGTLFALLLNLEFFARGLFRSLMVIPMVLTPAVIGIFFKLLYEQESGVFNYYLEALGLRASPGSASTCRCSPSSSWTCGRPRRSSC